MASLVEVQLDDVMDGLDKMVRAGKDLRPVWKAVRRGLFDDLHQHFSDRQGPEGAWAPRAQSSVERLLQPHGGKSRITRKGTLKRKYARILVNQLGRLKSWWLIKYDRGSLSATSGAKWSGIHQEGGVAGRGARIPARPFAWVSGSFLGAVADHVLEHIGKVW